MMMHYHHQLVEYGDKAHQLLFDIKTHKVLIINRKKDHSLTLNGFKLCPSLLPISADITYPQNN